MTELRFDLAGLPAAAQSFLTQIGADRIFLLVGDMGAGKTTFIAEVCKQLGALDDFGSPTFSLVNEYRDRDGNPVYHFDLYRIESPQEAMDFGIEEYFDSGCLCFVEWPDKLENLTPEESRIVSITLNEDGTRTVKF